LTVAQPKPRMHSSIILRKGNRTAFETTGMTTRTVAKLKKKQSLADQAYESLRAAVLHGQLGPGQRLNQAELASDLGVSDRTVREALARLVAEGLVSREPYREFRVIGVTAQDIEDIARMRGMLEGWAVEVAASKITAEELDRMRRLLPKMNSADTPQSAPSFQGYNRDFHWTAINACKKSHLIDMLKRLWDLMLPYSLGENGSELRDAAHIERLQQSHRELIAALSVGDGLAAHAILAKHSEETMEWVRMGAKRLNRFSQRENGRLFLQQVLPIRTS
jgi:DNA-binding GntR family transcriptional regulator